MAYRVFMVRTFFCREKRSCPDFDSVKIPTEFIRIERTIDQIKALAMSIPNAPGRAALRWSCELEPFTCAQGE
jgi:hypothetical protein